MSGAALLVLLAISTGLFAVGLFGLLARSGIFFQLLSLEIMLAAPALTFVAAGSYHGDAAGQAMFILILALAASEAALGLAIYLRLARSPDGADADVLKELRE